MKKHVERTRHVQKKDGVSAFGCGGLFGFFLMLRRRAKACLTHWWYRWQVFYILGSFFLQRSNLVLLRQIFHLKFRNAILKARIFRLELSNKLLDLDLRRLQHGEKIGRWIHWWEIPFLPNVELSDSRREQP